MVKLGEIRSPSHTVGSEPISKSSVGVAWVVFKHCVTIPHSGLRTGIA